MTDSQHPLSGVLSDMFSRAKKWWGCGLLTQLIASLVGAASVLSHEGSLAIALAIGIASTIASLSIWRSEYLRGEGEILLRHLELEDAFGWSINPKILADTLATTVRRAAQAAARAEEQGKFYSSGERPGALRALHNLSESAWWSQQLSRFLGTLSAVTATLLLVICLWSLLTAATSLGAATPMAVANIVTATIALAFSGALARLPIDYFSFSATARSFDERARQLVERGIVDSSEALRLYTDYQLERLRSPLLPDWAWRLRRKRLNAIWSQYRQPRGAAR